MASISYTPEPHEQVRTSKTRLMEIDSGLRDWYRRSSLCLFLANRFAALCDRGFESSQDQIVSLPFEF